ncbi:MAG TPA: response regulator [Bacteroidales bacterium]|nr:response regulator [Bacteroidales bacterium]
MKDEGYRILQIEDMPSDAYLIGREIKKILGRCELRVVENKADYLEELLQFHPHLIISDVSVPGFDWYGALSLTKEHAPATPFIVVTGAASDSIRKECLEAGADGYINKNTIRELLAPVVLKALQLVSE